MYDACRESITFFISKSFEKAEDGFLPVLAAVAFRVCETGNPQVAASNARRDVTRELRILE